jgi:DNA-binding beta-propeller fold protein YncE
MRTHTAKRARRAVAALLGAALVLLGAAPTALGAGTIYWANYFGDDSSPWGQISFADLTGVAGTDLSTGGATVRQPIGVAVDLAGGRIYWANSGANKISYARLDGSGGGDLPTTGATVSIPQGVALDIVAGRIYWANSLANRISYARLDGSGGADLATTGATVHGPIGVALDSAAGRVYWANSLGNRVSYARLDGSGGTDLAIQGATVVSPNFPVVVPADAVYVGTPKLNRRRGTATLRVAVPGRGTVTLGGKGLVRRRVTCRRPGPVRLNVRAKGAKLRKLERTGSVRVRAKVKFTPAGGKATARSTALTLRRKARAGA